MSAPEIVRLKNLVNEQDRTSGQPNAPVTLLEYGNFECFDCAQAHNVVKELQRNLGDDLRLVFRHFPTVHIHPRAMRAAEAAEAANAQGRFWEMVDQLFKHQQALEDRHLSHYAGRIGLDVGRFELDMSENHFLKEVEGAYQHALFDEHITGTPTFYINGVRYNGAISHDSIVLAIKQAAAQGQVHWTEHSGRLRQILERLHKKG
jgi:protein-disulfide isomerase